MKKLITVSLFGTAFAAQAEEMAEHMPEFWMPVQEHVVNNDIPQLLGYASDPALIKTYNPDAELSAFGGSDGQLYLRFGGAGGTALCRLCAY